MINPTPTIETTPKEKRSESFQVLLNTEFSSGLTFTRGELIDLLSENSVLRDSDLREASDAALRSEFSRQYELSGLPLGLSDELSNSDAGVGEVCELIGDGGDRIGVFRAAESALNSLDTYLEQGDAEALANAREALHATLGK